MAQTVKRQPAIWETWVRSLDREDPLEKEMATHSSTLAWKVPWMEEPGRPQSMGSQRIRHDWETSLSFSFCMIRQIKGNCLERLWACYGKYQCWVGGGLLGVWRGQGQRSCAHGSHLTLGAWMHLHDIPRLWEADDQQPVMNESPGAAESYHACPQGLTRRE